MALGRKCLPHFGVILLASFCTRPGLAASCDAILKFAFPDLCDLEVTRGNLKVHGLDLAYWKYSRKDGLQSSSGHVPIVAVHGGPSISHSYMLPLKQQACRGREIVFYDQVGCGESSRPADVHSSAPWLLTIEYYLKELKAVVDELGWQKFHFIGNSWGTIVGQEYAIYQRDPRLQGIVLSGPLSDADLYIRSQWDQKDGSLGSLPLFEQNEIHKLDAAKAYDSSTYKALDSALTTAFTCRTVPMPDCVSALLEGLNPEIYAAMQGASEFTIGGVLGDLNLTAQLKQIENPVLLTSGKYDTMRAPCVDALYRNLPRVWKAEMPHSGHMSMVDDPKAMNDVVAAFFDAVELGRLNSFDPNLAVPGSTRLNGVDMVAVGAWHSTPGQLPLWLVICLLGSVVLLLSLGFTAGFWASKWTRVPMRAKDLTLYLTE